MTRYTSSLLLPVNDTAVSEQIKNYVCSCSLPKLRPELTAAVRGSLSPATACPTACSGIAREGYANAVLSPP